MPDPNNASIAKLSFLKGARPETVERLVSAASERVYQPGEVILAEGSIGRDVLIILDGQVEVTKQQPGGEALLANRGAGDVFGEMSFLEDQPRFATVRAIETTRLLELSEASLRNAFAEQPELLYHTTQLLSSRLRQAQERMIADLQTKNAELERAYHDLQIAQVALVEKERMEHELCIAHDLQQDMLPQSFPKLPGFECAASYRPAREVGGDFFDVFALDNHRAGLVIADVSDKGLPAAMFMALTRSLIRAEARRSRSPSQVLHNVNRILMEISPGSMFVTVFYGILDLQEKKLSYARAGHDYPLLYRASTCECTSLTGAGMLLGMFEEIQLLEIEIDLQPGDLLILYTDGVVDTYNSAEDSFGLDRLRDLVCAGQNQHAQGLCSAIFDTVTAFQGNAHQFDDVTILVAGLL